MNKSTAHSPTSRMKQTTFFAISIFCLVNGDLRYFIDICINTSYLMCIYIAYNLGTFQKDWSVDRGGLWNTWDLKPAPASKTKSLSKLLQHFPAGWIIAQQLGPRGTSHIRNGRFYTCVNNHYLSPNESRKLEVNRGAGHSVMSFPS